MTELTYNIIPLWETNTWDGPLAGMCIYEGSLYYFEISNDELAEERLYDIYQISAEDIVEEVRAHALFEEYVGTHCNFYYDEDNKCYRRQIGALVNDPEKFKLFYDRYPPGARKPTYLKTVLANVRINF